MAGQVDCAEAGGDAVRRSTVEAEVQAAGRARGEARAETARAAEAGAGDSGDPAGQHVGQRAGGGVADGERAVRGAAGMDGAEVQAGGEVWHRGGVDLAAEGDGVAGQGGVGEAVDAARGGQRDCASGAVEVARRSGVEVDRCCASTAGHHRAAAAADRGEARYGLQAVEQALLVGIGGGAVVDRDRLRRDRTADARRAEVKGRTRHDRRRQRIHRPERLHRLRRQVRRPLTVNPGAIRLQADRRGPALHPLGRRVQPNHQAGAVGGLRRQPGKRPAVGKHRTRRATNLRVKRLRRAHRRCRVLDAQRLRNRRAHMHVAKIHRVRRRRAGRGIADRHVIGDGQGDRCQRLGIPGRVLIHRRQGHRFGIDPRRRGIHRDMHPLIPGARRDHRQRPDPADRVPGDGGRRQVAGQIVAASPDRVLHPDHQVGHRLAKLQSAQIQGPGVAALRQRADAGQQREGRSRRGAGFHLVVDDRGLRIRREQRLATRRRDADLQIAARQRTQHSTGHLHSKLRARLPGRDRY